MKRRTQLLNYYSAMLAELGPSHWWPGETPFEVALGTILTQNTAWANVEKALSNLRGRGLLQADALAALSEVELAEYIRSAGAFRVKAKRVRNFLQFLERTCALEITNLRTQPVERVRSALLEVSGIGPETADSILLYALDKPSFVVDAYTRRIFSRHFLIPEDMPTRNCGLFLWMRCPWTRSCTMNFTR